MNAQELTHYLADAPPSVVRLEIEKHFEPLTDKQKRYAHFISKPLEPDAPSFYGAWELNETPRASFAGSRIVLRQLSPESEPIYDFIIALHKSSGGDWNSLAKKAGVDETQLSYFLEYAAQFLGNNGNYKSFGDAKFIPRAEEKTFAAFAATSPKAERFYKATNGAIFSSDKQALMHLGYPDKGHMTTYYPDSPHITQNEIEAVSAWMEKKGLLPENTRLRKTKEGSFELLIASAVTSVPTEGGKTIKLVYGDYAEEMKAISEYIKKAQENSSNEIQAKMHEAYAKSFSSGSLLDFKDSQRYWIRDKGPMDFEKDKFLSPDFTSLEVLTFAGSGIPAGINIPNYDDIRQTEGFKNVSLGNVLSAKAPNEKIPFISEADLELYHKYRDPAFEVQVGLHELTGHGCGKLLQETSPGTFNFDEKNPPVSPLTNKPVTTWYKPGQTWGSVFGSLAASYEECRAELVAMYLGCEFPVLKIFGFGDGTTDINNEAGNVLYAAYLQMARAGLVSLEMWDPKSQKWGQAHSQARFSILQCFLQAGDDFCKLEYKNDDLSDLEIKLDRSKILTTGRDAVGKYLQKLHVYKVTADVENGTAFYKEMTNVDMDFWGTKARNVVLKNKQPRKVFVQANTFLDEASGKVSLKHYEASPVGMIQSWADREL
ncbi:peptidase family M49 protein [Colletotrichum higginsianum]|nr:peptidase family M49 protein [Colletotrichum higginsianum]